MAEETGGGGGFGKKLGPFPVWVWAIGAGGIFGLVYFLRKKNAAAATTDTSATADTGDEQTSIVPVDQGLSEGQWAELLAAIRALQGPASTPVTPPDHSGEGPQPITNPPPIFGGPHTRPPSHFNPPPAGSPAPRSTTVKIKQGSGTSWSSLAAQYGHKWQDLWNYNLTPGVRSASSEAKLRSEGPNHSLFGGTTVYVPASWRKVK